MRTGLFDDTLRVPCSAEGWIIRMHRRNLTPGECEAFAAWMKAGRQRSRELLRAHSVWLLLGGLAGRPEVDAELALLRQRPPSPPLPWRKRRDRRPPSSSE